MKTYRYEKDLVKDIVDKVLKPLGSRAWWFKVHGGPYQKAGVSDLVGVIDGVPFGLEVKLPGKYPTPLQAKILAEMQRAGAVTGWADSLEEAQAILGRCLRRAA